MAIFDGEREQKLVLSESLLLRMNRLSFSVVQHSTFVCLFVCVIHHSPNGETVTGLFIDELFAKTNSGRIEVYGNGADQRGTVKKIYGGHPPYETKFYWFHSVSRNNKQN